MAEYKVANNGEVTAEDSVTQQEHPSSEQGVFGRGHHIPDRLILVLRVIESHTCSRSRKAAPPAYRLLFSQLNPDGEQ